MSCEDISSLGAFIYLTQSMVREIPAHKIPWLAVAGSSSHRELALPNSCGRPASLIADHIYPVCPSCLRKPRCTLTMAHTVCEQF
jgi:hypothetical protein